MSLTKLDATVMPTGISSEFPQDGPTIGISEIPMSTPISEYPSINPRATPTNKLTSPPIDLPSPSPSKKSSIKSSPR